MRNEEFEKREDRETNILRMKDIVKEKGSERKRFRKKKVEEEKG